MKTPATTRIPAGGSPGRQATWSIRHPSPAEAEAVFALFAGEVELGELLPRSIDDLVNACGDWLVAFQGDRAIGCASLLRFDEELSEIRTLAVRPECRGWGIGRDLVHGILRMAQERGAPRVLTLTRQPEFFSGLGFRHTEIDRFPQKVWNVCEMCPRKDECDEVALVYEIPADSGARFRGRERRHGDVRRDED